MNRRIYWRGAVRLVTIAVTCGALSATAFQTISPREAGLDGARLSLWKDALAAQKTTGLLVVRHGRIALEWYAPGWNAGKPHGTASMAKALVGGMSLLIAIADHRISADDPAAKYIAAWKSDPLKSKITIRELATHTSGIEDAEQGGLPHEQLTGWKGDFWKRSPDPFSVAVHDAPVIFEPGTQNAYSNPGMAALAYAVTKSLPNGDIRALLKQRILDPLGVPESEWSIGYNHAYELDGLKLYANWGGGSFTARAAARIGQLMMLQGAWDGRQLLPRDAVKKTLTYAGMPKPARTLSDPAPSSGLAWYLNSDGVWPAVPRDAFAGAGAGHQVIIVIPSLDMIVVRNGDAIAGNGRGSGFWGPVYENLLRPLMGAVVEQAPYPASTVIQGLRWGAEVKRAAIESDNWPITWGDDDLQYTSYGDGWGFDPHVEKKLGMGFAKIAGAAADFRGVNIRSDGERVGDGRQSAKASGIVMVDGILYLWVRNVSNAQLAWSADHGKTWQWGFKIETSFGSPAFLNFGRNYGGARDNFVYTYSQDGDSAYESDNQIVLARAPKGRIRERLAWEFFAGLDASGRSQWTREIGGRAPVFVHPAGCQRVDVVYDPGLKRYLMAVGYNHDGAWGLFDAPQLWGPWTTVFHTDGDNPAWRIPGTHGYRLPAKWISGDGRSLTLVFSGVRQKDTTYDAFCTRSLELLVSR